MLYDDVMMLMLPADAGKKWLADCKSRNNGQTGDCGDYLYDFYPDVLQ